MNRFDGKKVLVTGAASGIGQATAIRFAEEGAHVVIADINEAGLAATAEQMANAPMIRPYNALDNDSSQALVNEAAKGGLDVVCNISGTIGWGPSESFSLDEFERIMQINTTSVFAICQAALPHLEKTKGTIINTASTAALQGVAYTIAYAASKHAVAGITKSLAIEYGAKGVRVNAICPGHVDTPLAAQMMENVPEGIDFDLVMRNAPKLLDGTCQPSDIASLFAYLASQEASKVTGSLFTMDGGQLAG
ncbi:short-chain dehydrogenase/reductase SDR [alpha proteobacterium IMCC14465]|uniref:Short-chain dehydrogenase/reductase SDR n=1 Tax=alpha proteobacterium IMCC14465 TaxID=1220535 RepID=J9DGX0_9PROT|nr:short-chain dehydrogenase/reductase SDR [alpha proteobacterium IMCC14465]